jgi:hypothetical protein
MGLGVITTGERACESHCYQLTSNRQESEHWSEYLLLNEYNILPNRTLYTTRSTVSYVSY